MKNKEKLTATISASTELFDFLKEKVGERKTRTEAYCDLLDKSQAGFISPFLRKQDFELGPSQCHVTVSDLASEWHWHRATVRSFLETLESFGQLERTKLPKSMVITMRLHDGNYVIPDIAQGETGFVQQLNGVMSGWVNGNIASYDAGIACGKIVHKAITDAGLKDELPEDDCIVTLRKLSERMDKRVLEIRATAVECPSFINLSEKLAEHIINLSKDKDIDYDDDCQVLLNNLHDPFISVAAKALGKSAGADY